MKVFKVYFEDKMGDVIKDTAIDTDVKAVREKIERNGGELVKITDITQEVANSFETASVVSCLLGYGVDAIHANVIGALLNEWQDKLNNPVRRSRSKKVADPTVC